MVEARIDQLLADLKECSRTRDLARGKQVHGAALEFGHLCSCYVASALINMYAKCGSMVHARQVFDTMEHPNVVSWTALILGYAENGEGVSALEMFMRMRAEGPTPDSVTFVAALKSCAALASMEEASVCAKTLQNLIAESGCSSNIYVQSTLIDTYGKCGRMRDAHRVFDSMKSPNVVSWNALILGYADNGQGFVALHLFTQMRSRGPAPSSITFVATLKACSSVADVNGWVHCRGWVTALSNLATENGSLDLYVQNTVIDMYCRCNSMPDAHRMFIGIRNSDIVSWNALILGYAEQGEGLAALELFRQLKTAGLAPVSITFVAALRACISVSMKEGASVYEKCRKRGNVLQNLAVQNGCSSDIYVASTLIDMYSRCGSMGEARLVFDSIQDPNVVAWNALVLGYADNGQGFAALDMLSKMKAEGPSPSSVTFVAALKACTSIAMDTGWGQCRELAKSIQNLAIENAISTDIYVHNTLIDTFAKCGSMADAQQIFDCMEHSKVVSWNALISGYAENGQGLCALDLFTRMQSEGPTPDSVTFLAVLKACGLLGALEVGRKIHSEIHCVRYVVLVTCLVDFYAKCGALLEAQGVFDLYADARNMVTWNALLAGFSSSGDYESVYRQFWGMQDAGFQPNSVTILSVLKCCSHAGLVDKGKECFAAMRTKFGVAPTVEHYTCMIDIYGRGNKLNDAMALFKSMPCSPDKVTWTIVLGVCHRWKNVGIGRLAFEALRDLSSTDAGVYVVMEQIYASRGMLRHQEMVMRMRMTVAALKACKSSAESCWTNEEGQVHSFKNDILKTIGGI